LNRIEFLKLFLFFISLMVLPVACTTSDQPASGVYEGYYLAAEEISSFVPCGMDATPAYGVGYWLESAPGSSIFDAYDGLTEFGTVVYIRFEGTLSPPSQNGYGHINSYDRQVTVTRLLKMSLDGQCLGE
jgi:hypothetical protein